MLGPISTKSLPDILEDGFRMIFLRNFRRYPMQWLPLYEVLTSTRQNEDDSSVGTLGLAVFREENEPVTYDAVPQGFDVTYTHQELALGMLITQRIMEDDRYDIVTKLPGQIGVSIRETINVDVVNDFNNAFDTNFLGGDGKPLCSTTHPLSGGGTESNTLAAPADLSVDSLEQVDIDIASWVDERGKRVVFNPRRLVIPKQLEATAKRVLRTSKEPGTANNDINPYEGYLTPHVLNHLTDPDNWFVQCDEHYMKYFNRVGPQFTRANDFDTDQLKFKGRTRFSHGWSDWYGMYGVQGGAS